MQADYTSLLIAQAVSSFAIVMAVLASWTSARKDHYLFLSAIGVGLVMVALILMSLRDGRYVVETLIVPFTLMHAGTGFIYAGVRKFLGKPDLLPAIAAGAGTALVTAISMLVGLLGLTYILHNIFIGAVLLLCAAEYAGARNEWRGITFANAVLYLVIGLFFFAPAVPAILAGDLVTYPPTASFLDTINAIMAIVGVTGIGALTLTLHFSRAADRNLAKAHTDPLTGVLNRRALFERFDADRAIPGRAVLVFDLDHFKLINDQLGHAQGDRTLRNFGELLLLHFSGDAVAARIGGEEFCVVLARQDAEQAREMADDLRIEFAGLSLPSGRGDAAATVSVGLATGGPDESFESVLSRADAALYKAKQAGRNTVFQHLGAHAA